MGWKTIKEHYDIKHIVQVDKDREYGEEPVIMIGSSFIHDIIVIRPSDGKILKRYTDRGVNKLLQALQPRLDEDEKSGKLKELIDAKDTFDKLLPVYSIGDHKRIRLMWCEHYGYPNVTTDGELMYENIFYSQLKAAKYHLMRNTKMDWRNWWRYNVRGRFKVIGEQFKLFFKYDLREIWECVYVRCWGVFFVKGGRNEKK